MCLFVLGNKKMFGLTQKIGLIHWTMTVFKTEKMKLG